MKKHFLISIIAIIYTVSPYSLYAQDKNHIIIGSIDSLYSNTLNEQRKIWVHIPESADNKNLKEYPVLYLLDGDAYFHMVTGITKELSFLNNSPEMIVVGIPNINRASRTRDFSPTKVAKRSGSGGSEAFTTFLEKELIPYIENKYPTKPYRMLIGHSLGGLMVVNTLINHPNLFNSYVAIDPSIFWDDRKILKRTTEALKNKKFKGKSLYLSIANTLGDDMDINTVMKDTTRKTNFIRSILELKNAALTNSQNQLNFEWKYYADESHSSVPITSHYDGLRFMFSWYQMKGAGKFYDPKIITTGIDVTNFVISHYSNVSDHLGYTVLPPEQMVNGFAYGMMRINANDKALALFELNIKNYPKSANVYDSIGDYYVSISNTSKAIEHFAKSVEIGGIPESKEKLEKLKAGK